MRGGSPNAVYKPTRKKLYEEYLKFSLQGRWSKIIIGFLNCKTLEWKRCMENTCGKRSKDIANREDVIILGSEIQINLPRERGLPDIIEYSRIYISSFRNGHHRRRDIIIIRYCTDLQAHMHIISSRKSSLESYC